MVDTKSKAQKKIQRVKRLYSKVDSLLDEDSYPNERERIESKIRDVANGKFRVVVAGEVSSGKSTFINALLGEDILPTGTNQTTSSIIKINNQEKKKLQITYADGSQSVEKDQKRWEETVASCLRGVGAIPDEYRDLPVPLLQAYRKETKDRWREKLDALIDRIVDDGGKNPQDHSKEKFKKRCCEYLKREADLGAIPEEIKIGFPFREEFQRLQIIDSPGVHAVGAVEDVTHEYVSRAHAILFLRKASDPPESSSFSDFVRDNVSNRSRDALFLVLTNAEKEGRRALKTKKGAYQRRFQGMVGIRPTNILAVDSVAELLAQDAAESDLASIESHYENKLVRYDEGETDGSVDPLEVEFKLETLQDAVRKNDDRDVIIEDIERRAGFGNVVDKLSDLEDESIHIQLEEIVCRLLEMLQKYETDLHDEIELDEAALQGSEELKAEVKERKKEIDGLRDRLSMVKTEMKQTYIDDQGEKKRIFREEVGQSKQAVEEASSVDEVTSETDVLQRVVGEYFDTWIDGIHDAIVKEIKDSSSLAKPKVSLPSFEISDKKISTIKQKSKVKKTKKHYCKQNKTYWKLNRYKYMKKVKKQAKEKIENKKDESWSKYKGQAVSLINSYIKTLKVKLEKKKEKYNKKRKERIDVENREERLKKMKNTIQEVREAKTETASFLQSFKPNASCLSTQ